MSVARTRSAGDITDQVVDLGVKAAQTSAGSHGAGLVVIVSGKKHAQREKMVRIGSEQSLG
jgi:hypothetical protein